MNAHQWFFLFCLNSSLVWGVPQIQVRIEKDLKKILISGMDLQSSLFLLEKNEQHEGRKTVSFNCQRQGVGQGLKKPALVASLSSPTGLISWEERHYRGELSVVTSKNLNACDLIHKTSMKDYLSSLLAKEMNPRWPLEALKAQAVAARSYALVQSQRGENSFFDLENSERHQVTGHFFDQSSRTTRAVRETLGVVLVGQDQKIVPAFFHSKCGGRTYLPQEVWSESVWGYRRVQCPYCHELGRRDWKRFLSRVRLKKILREKPSGFKNSHLRKKLGRKFLPSHNFVIDSKREGERVVIKGRGFGHGVGLCQHGAFEMAKRGKSYLEILSHYYPEFRVKKWY